MPLDSDLYDLFISYAREDNKSGWITAFVDALVEEHLKFSSGRKLEFFFDKEEIGPFSDWRHTLHDGIAASRLFLAFVSPRYFASEWCRKEWRAWIDHEISKHILSQGAAPVYIVNIPSLTSDMEPEAIAREVAALCNLPTPHDAFLRGAAPVIGQMHRRQFIPVQDFYTEGLEALRKESLRVELERLAREVDKQVEFVRSAAHSVSTVPAYNKCFSGRLDELNALYNRLTDDQAGVITGIHGLGGIGKTELAYAYAHAFAGFYPGGRFEIPCDKQMSLQYALFALDRSGRHAAEGFAAQINDEERKSPDAYFAAILRCLRKRIETHGRVLLVLDNVSDLALLSREQTDPLTAIGPQLHLLATTRLLPPAAQKKAWLTLGELPESDAMDLLEKHRPFNGPDGRRDDAEWKAALSIVRQLGGFALATELVGAWLRQHTKKTYAELADGLGLEDLEREISTDPTIELCRHNHEKRLSIVLNPILDGLSKTERRVMEYAAFLAPDAVPLSWLKVLVMRDFPKLGKVSRLHDPWEEVCDKLIRLTLLQRGTDNDDETFTYSPPEAAMFRVHRLVQEVIASRMCFFKRWMRQWIIWKFVKQQLNILPKNDYFILVDEIPWELTPIDQLTCRWDDKGNLLAISLLLPVANIWESGAVWTSAAALYRRYLAFCDKYGKSVRAKKSFAYSEIRARLNALEATMSSENQAEEIDWIYRTTTEPMLRQRLENAQKLHGTNHPEVAKELDHLAHLLEKTDRLSEAEELRRRGLAINEAAYGPNHPDVAINLEHLAELLSRTDRINNAEPLLRRALQITETVHGTNHPYVASALTCLGDLLSDVGRSLEAEPLYRRALEITKKFYSLEEPDDEHDAALSTIVALTNLAGVLNRTNRQTEAIPLYFDALSLVYPLTDDEGIDYTGYLGKELTILAQFLEDGNPEEAEIFYRNSLGFVSTRWGQNHPQHAKTLKCFGFFLQKANRVVEAEPLLREALEIYKKCYGDDYPETIAVREALQHITDQE